MHGLLLAWLLHSPRPIFVAPTSVLGGVGGSTVTNLYWPVNDGGVGREAPGQGDAAASRSRNIFRLLRRSSKQTEPAHDQGAFVAAAQDPSSGDVTGRSAGSPYGSLSEGPAEGHDIRAALPMATVEPIVGGSSVSGVAEGNCVVEITIDEGGSVVAEAVVQSMGPEIDAAVLAAVAQWRFRPATRDGVPIPSKQDVVYHFKPRA